MKRSAIILIAILSALVLIGCGTTKQIEVVDRVTHDTLYMNKVQYDSIYLNDSFIMDYHPSKEFIYLLDSILIMKVDTMYIRDRQLEYKYKYLHDTTYIHRVDTIPVIHTIEVEKPIKYTPWYAKALAWLGVILLLFLIIRIIIKIYLK